MAKKIILDCDPGIDDAIAFTLALSSPVLDVVGITTVTGNVSVENTTRNACNIAWLLGRGDIPVAKGAAKPLAREPFRASGVHGVTGLRGYNFEEDHYGSLSPLPAWDFMKKTLLESEEKITIVAIGPVTNIAILFEKYPEVKEKVEEIVFMGTSWHDGNPTPIATFNVLADPEAFRALLFSGVPVVSCPLDLTRTVVLTADEIEEIKGMGTPVSRFVSALLDNYGLQNVKKDENISGEGEEVITEARINASKKEGVTLHDPVTVGCAIAPELYRGTRYYCDVECKGEITLGFTLVDKKNWHGKKEEEKNLLFMEDMDRSAFRRMLVEAIRSYR